MSLRQFVVGVVDDDPRVLESVEELLTSGGYRALPFLSAETFLSANGFQQVDCLISDIGMPVISGVDLLEIGRTQHPHVPVILITARDEEALRETIKAKGARHLFSKPFDGREFLAVLDSLFRLERPRQH